MVALIPPLRPTPGARRAWQLNGVSLRHCYPVGTSGRIRSRPRFISMHYAHSANSRGERHPLVDHLKAVATLTRSHARNLGAEDLGYHLGLWHDLGKFDSAFQANAMEGAMGES